MIEIQITIYPEYIVNYYYKYQSLRTFKLLNN